MSERSKQTDRDRTIDARIARLRDRLERAKNAQGTNPQTLALIAGIIDMLDDAL